MASSKAPLISVIIPTYNRRGLILRAVDSALSQTEKDIEVIIVDDGSTDGTAELFREGQDPRVHYLPMPHRGACAARNAGLEAARGQYIAFLDSDDVWRGDKLEKQLKQLTELGADVVFCALHQHSRDGNVLRIPEDSEPEGPVSAQRLLKGNIASTQTLFGKAACMKQSRFDEQFPRMQDWDYVIRVAQAYRLYYCSRVLVDAYPQADSISSHPELGLAAMRLLCAKYRRELEASVSSTRCLLGALRSFAEQCGQGFMMDYLRAMSPRRSVKDNGMLLLCGVAATLRSRFQGLRARGKT